MDDFKSEFMKLMDEAWSFKTVYATQETLNRITREVWQDITEYHVTIPKDTTMSQDELYKNFVSTHKKVESGEIEPLDFGDSSHPDICNCLTHKHQPPETGLEKRKL